MAVINGPGNLSTALGGNVDSTNTIIKNPGMAAIIRIANIGGATPTVTINILGSINGTDFFNVPYSTVAAPSSQVVAAIVVTTTATNHFYLPAGYAYAYLKLNYSVNTNETITADLLY